MSFTEEQIRAATRPGQLSDPEAEGVLVRTLIERQRKIGRYAFSQVNPLDQFRISATALGPHLQFQDLALHYGLADPAATWYSSTFSPHGEQKSLAVTRRTRGRQIPLDALLRLAQRADPDDSLFVLTLRTQRAEPHFRDKWVNVFLERQAAGLRVRGWEREK